MPCDGIFIVARAIAARKVILISGLEGDGGIKKRIIQGMDDARPFMIRLNAPSRRYFRVVDDIRRNNPINNGS